MLLKKRRSQDKQDGGRPQYELDHDLSPLERHFMFWEYLEIGKTVMSETLPYAVCSEITLGFQSKIIFKSMKCSVQNSSFALTKFCHTKR